MNLFLRFLYIGMITLFLLCLSQPLLAWTLSGTIYGGANPYPGALVNLKNGETLVDVDSTTTDVNGFYSFTELEDGSYNLIITAAGYEESVVNGIDLIGADFIQNAVLIKEPFTVSGTVRYPDGTVAQNITVSASPVSSGSVTGGLSVTDPSGMYSIAVSEGEFKIMIGRSPDSGEQNKPSPSVFSFGTAESISVTANTTLPDYTIPPFATISGKTTDANGVPIGNLEIIQPYYRWTDSNNAEYYTDTQWSDSDESGNYSIIVLAGDGYTFNVLPPDGSTLLPATYRNVDIATDTIYDLALIEPFILSGTVRYPDGTVAQNIIVRATGGTSGGGASVTDESGRYSIAVSEGEFDIQIGKASDAGEQNKPSPGAFGFNPAEPITVTANTTLPDYTLPAFATISGKTTDANGVPIANVKVVQYTQRWLDDDGSEYATDIQWRYSDESGDYSIIVLAGTGYTFRIIPPEGSTLLPTTYQNVDLLTDTIYDFALTEPFILSGTVRYPDGIVAQNIIVMATGGTSGGASVTDESGRYAIAVSEGEFNIQIGKAPDAGEQNKPSPSAFNFKPADSITVTANTTLPDYTIPPFATITGKTTDSNGVPIGNVRITQPYVRWNDGNQAEYYTDSQWRDSDEAGNYSMIVLAGEDYTFYALPPEGSNFLSTIVPNIDISTDILHNWILVMPDNSPPVILAGPFVSMITDTSAVISWQTNELAIGGVNVGINNPPTDTTNENESVTTHSIPLHNLSANSTYYVNVFASDASGNGPSESGVISFTTKTTPDTTAPVIISGPDISSIDHSSAVLEWSTDEPSFGDVSYGTSDSLGETLGGGQLSTNHKVRVTGLNAETIYYLQVEAMDDSGNGPALSSLLDFNTVAIPDTAAPNIVEGPMVIKISDSEATIIWTTDEPATSGVSYNDGTVYGVFSDSTLVREHIVHLESLTESTLYNYVVSAKDAMANGPTLSEQKQFATPDSPDTSPPVITEYPVKHVNHQQAIIAWRTDEPASSVIEYGVSPQELTEVENHAALTKPHNMTLTGLESGTTYYFRIISTDAGGQHAISQIWEFTTDAAPGNKKPVITKNPETVYSGDDTLTVTWETDVPTDTVLEYTKPGELPKRCSNSKVKNKHQVTLKGLIPDTEYSIAVAATDVDGNRTLAKMGDEVIRLAFIGDSGVFIPPTTAKTLSAADQTAPAISEGPTVVGRSDKSVVIQWSTDEIADSLIRYGLHDEPLAKHSGDIADTSTHIIVLTNLTPDTTYDYTVEATDPDGNGPTISSLYSFTTSASADGTAPGFTIAPNATMYSETHALILWSTDEPASTVLHYGPSSENPGQSSAVSGLSSDHRLTITNLLPGTTYYFNAEATDNSGNKSNSIQGSFTTMGVAPPSPGDVNGDGSVGLADVITALKVVCGNSPAKVFKSADTNNDGRIGVVDAIAILRTVTGVDD